MSQTFDDMLAHFGVRGMRWGIRKDPTGAREDAKWAQKTGRKESARIFSEAAQRMNKDLPSINAKYTDKSLQNPTIAEKYKKELDASFEKHVKAVAGELISPSGNRKLGTVTDPETGWVMLTAVDITHAVIPGISYRPILDSNGFVIEYVLVEDDIMQSQLDQGKAFLEHFGVRGMRWGVRKRSGSDKSSDDKGNKGDDGDSTKKESSKKTGDSDSSHGKKTSNKKQDVNELSDAQLRDALNRLQMEKQYRELTSAPPGKLAAGKKFAQQAIRQIAMQQAVAVGNSHAAKYTAKFMANTKSAEATVDAAKKVASKAAT